MLRYGLLGGRDGAGWPAIAAVKIPLQAIEEAATQGQAHADHEKPEPIEVVDPWLGEVPSLNASRTLIPLIALLLSHHSWKRTLELFLSGTRWQACEGKDRHLLTDLSLMSNKMPTGGLFPTARSPPTPSLQSTPWCSVISLCGRNLGNCSAASNIRNVNGCRLNCREFEFTSGVRCLQREK